MEVIEQCLAPNTLDAIHIFFPDPWHKKRHHKRRLIQPKLVQDLATLLRADGYLHLATDWVPYAEHMFEVLDAEALLVNATGEPGTAVPRPDYRPPTKFEARGEDWGISYRTSFTASVPESLLGRLLVAPWPITLFRAG